jgi:hypothetical protein
MKSVKWKIVIFLMFSTKILAQNYYQEYPIVVSIVSNGIQSRIQCTTYDSVLQATQTYYTLWRNESHIISSNNFGKVGYTLWSSPVSQYPAVGFITYDYILHQFVEKLIPVPVGTDIGVNVVSGLIWLSVVKHYDDDGWIWANFKHYRYDLYEHQWYFFEVEHSIPTLSWSYPPLGNSDFFYEPIEYFLFNFIDPVKNNIVQQTVVNDSWKIKDDYAYGTDVNANDQFFYYTYDPVKAEYCKYPRANLTEGASRGIYFAKDTTDLDKHFFFRYDQGIQDWVTDSVESSLITNLQVKDGVVTYFDSIPGVAKKVHCMVFNPLQHQWVRDSVNVVGNGYGLQIDNGTIKWTDANGINIRGYDNLSGWGNYNTSLFLYFALEDYFSDGAPVVFVRNYSIGTESIYYDFGDGIQSTDNLHVKWHGFKNSGTYNICIVDSATGQSGCQTFTFNQCANAGIAMASDSILCQGDSIELTLSSYTGSIQWQKKSGNAWIDETLPGATSSNYLIAPSAASEYRAKVVVPGCIPSVSNVISIKYEPAISNYSLSDTLVLRCSGIFYKLEVLGSNVSSFTWQINTGSNWSNLASTTSSILAGNAGLYRVIQSSGYCISDTSEVITVTDTPVLPAPNVVPDFTCGPDSVTLSVTSAGTAHWNIAFGNTLLFVGNPFTPFISTTTSYEVRVSDGYITNVGIPDTSVGSTTGYNGIKIGQRLATSNPSILNSIDLYSDTTTSIYISLVNSVTNQLIRNIPASLISGFNRIKVGFGLVGNVTYDLFITPVAGNLKLRGNNSGYSYPMTEPTCPVTVTGYTDSIFHNTSDLYVVYNLSFTTGCLSSKSTVVGTVYPAINGFILPAGNVSSFCQGDSLKLNAFPTGLNSYDWFLNGMNTGYSGQSYTVKVPGNYSVQISSSNCTSLSPFKRITMPCVHQLDAEEKPYVSNGNDEGLILTAHFIGNNMVEIQTHSSESQTAAISISDISGHIVYKSSVMIDNGSSTFQLPVTDLAASVYFIRLETGRETIIAKAIKMW